MNVEMLYQKYGAMVLRRCRRLLREEDHALDAMQDVFVRVLQRQDSLKATYPSSLLYRIATNVCLNRNTNDCGFAFCRWVYTRGSCWASWDVGFWGAKAIAWFARIAEGFGGFMMLQHIPEWKLERFRLGELPKEEMAAIRQAADTDSDLQARIEALNVSDQEIHASYPAKWMARQIEQRVDVTDQSEAPGSSHWFGSGLALAAVMLLAVVISIWLPGPEAPKPWDQKGMDGIRLKGAQPKLLLYRKNASEHEHLTDHSIVHAGDLIQIFYRAAGKSFGIVVSMDGRGAVSQHWPESGTKAARLTQGEPVSLGYAYELDDAPKWERFYFVTSDEVFEVDIVTKLLQGEPDSLQLGNGFEQYSITLYKGAE